MVKKKFKSPVSKELREKSGHDVKSDSQAQSPIDSEFKSPVEQRKQEILSFVKALGPYKDKVILVGGTAVFVYANFGKESPSAFQPTYTVDIDSLLCRRLTPNKINEKRLSDYLTEAGYTSVVNGLAFDTSSKSVNGEKWEPPLSEKGGLYIEFLTHDNNKRNHDISGVAACGLTYLDMSLKRKIEYKIGDSGIYAVAPEAHIFHKGLTFTRRRHSSKKRKDLYYITYVANYVFADLERAIEALKKLMNDFPSPWKKSFLANMKKAHESYDESEYSLIKAQDSENALSIETIRKTIEMMSRLDDV